MLNWVELKGKAALVLGMTLSILRSSPGLKRITKRITIDNKDKFR